MNRIKPNWLRYLESLAAELYSQSTRVRDLIGDAHWLSDGHHKEYLLLGLINRHLPSGMLASRGFVISPNEPSRISTEQDILVVDASIEAPVFLQGSLAICFPAQVRAAVSVKTTLNAAAIRDSVRGLATVKRVAKDDGIDTRSIWCGSYFFEVSPEVARDPTHVYHYLSDDQEEMAGSGLASSTAHHNCLLAFLCSARDLAFKLQHLYSGDDTDRYLQKVIGYRCASMATALFLGELLDHLAYSRSASEGTFAHFADHAAFDQVGEPFALIDRSATEPPEQQ